MKLRAHILPLSLGAAFFLLGLLRLNDLSLYTDSTRYLLWANSLAHFKGFIDETLPIPSRFVMNAPLYPILLVPSQLFFSFSIVSAKIWTLLFGALSVGFFFHWLRRTVGLSLAIGGAFFFALNPMMLVVSTEVLSEAPFLAGWMLLLLLMEKRLSGEKSGSGENVLFFSVLALIILMREVAMAILAAAAFHFLSQKEYKRAAAVFFPPLLVYLLWMLRTLSVGETGEPGQGSNVQYIFQHFVTPGDSRLLTEFVVRLSLNLKGYLFDMGPLLFYPFPNLAAEPSSTLQSMATFLSQERIFFLLLLTPIVVFGMILDVRNSPSAFFRILSVVFYVVILLLYPVHDLRFLLPLLPLGLFFVLQSVAWISARLSLSKTSGTAITVIGWSFFLFPNLLCDIEILGTAMTYRRDPAGFSSRSSDSRTIPGYYRRAWSAAGDWITAALPGNAVIASPAKEIAPFVGNHKVLELSRTVPTPVFERQLRDNHAQYLLAYTLWGNLRTYEFQMNESRRWRFEPLKEIGDIMVYRISSSIERPNPQQQDHPPLATHPAASDYLRFGRYDFMNLRYADAILGFTLARNEEPQRPEPYMNLLTVYAAVADTAGALRAFQGLSALPESTPYIPAAQVHLNLMRLLRGASEAQIPYVRSTMATNAAITCWNLGYPRLALRIASNVIKLDSSFFNARLWASHFARQLGDTLLAYRHLRALEAIDKDAPIVKDFQFIKLVEDSLRKERTNGKKAIYHRSLARIYAKLQLPEEEIDEIERALRREPQKLQHLLELARAFEQKGASYAALKTYERILKVDASNEIALAKLGRR